MPSTHIRIRTAASGIAGIVAVLYLLTGTGLLAVTDSQEPGIIPPLLVGAAVYALLAALAARRPTRALLGVGAGLQVPFILMYVAIAAERTPAFEVWGITIKVLQLLLLGTFAWLALHRPAQATTPGGSLRAA